MWSYCVAHNHLCLMRLREKYNLCKKSTGDIHTFLPGNKKEGTPDIEVRVIEVTLSNGTKEYLATNLFDPSITKDMFQELYFYRWPIEIKYKELKSRLAMEEFSGATTISVFQEFYINMLLSNLSSLIKNQADEEIDGSSKNINNRHRYQANRSFIIGRVKRLLPKILCGIYELTIIDALLTDAVKRKSQISPGRSYPRKRNKAIGRTHFKNKKVTI